MPDEHPPTSRCLQVESQWLMRFDLRDISCILLVFANILWFWKPLVLVFTSSLQDESAQHYSHITLVPLLCLYLLYLRRSAIFATMKWNPFLGSVLMIIGVSASLCTNEPINETHDRLFLATFSFVMTCWGAFLFCYGTQAFRQASFELGLLTFMVPLPSLVLDTAATFLQHRSADSVELLFSVLGIQAHRDGSIFELSNFIILIEEECSGIRSCFALVITSLVAGHWVLTSWWARAALVAVVVPLAIIKNGSRIVGLALLANYIDPAFIMDSALHRYGGIPLFGLSFAMLICITWLLRKLELQCERNPPNEFLARS